MRLGKHIVATRRPGRTSSPLSNDRVLTAPTPFTPKIIPFSPTDSVGEPKVLPDQPVPDTYVVVNWFEELRERIGGN